MKAWAYHKKKNNSGQIVVEYILLLIVSVTLAFSIVTILVNRNPDSQGILIQKWVQITNFIGLDMADDPEVSQ